MAWYNASWTYRKSITVDYTKLTADVSNFPVFLKLDDLGADFWSAVKNGGNLRWIAVAGSAGAASKSGPTTGSWQYFVGVESASNSRVAYRNAVAGTAETTSLAPASVDCVTVMTVPYTGEYNRLPLPTADVDEVRISNSARISQWITAEYNNQNSPSTFYSLGSQESNLSTIAAKWQHYRLLRA